MNALGAALIAGALIVVPGISAFGHGDEARAPVTKADTPVGRAGDLNKVTRTIRITAVDTTFDVAELIFAKGETVRFILQNKGKQDHELTLGDAAMQEEHRALMTKMSRMSHAEQDAAMSGHENYGNSIHVKPGGTGELVWQFTNAGSFEFACNYPGHADLGMFGAIKVQ
jgi:uncharacterized cupredoxin-like copper-binding protein